jgi:hypothetical protein
MNKQKWIVTGLIVIVLVLVAVGLYLGGSNLMQMIQAHLAG